MMVPAIVPKSEGHLEASLVRLKGVSSDVQIDIVDGVYASPSCWPFIDSSVSSLTEQKHRGEFLPFVGTFSFEIDLMVSDPKTIADLFIDLGASRIVLHFGSAKDIQEVIDYLGDMHGYQRNFAPGLLSIGIALSIDTPLAVLKPYIDSVDFVQLMGIDRIGVQGEPFNPKVIERIKETRKLYGHVPIQIDGGVSLENAPELLSAGADRLIVGSHLWHSHDLKDTVEAFEALGERYGLYT
jgi:ribulose-phosphate 3-epimerase